MAYNLYQVQMARAWAERIKKEDAQAEKFWMDTIKGENGSKPGSPGSPSRHPAPVLQPTYAAAYAGSYAGSAAGSQARSAAPTGYTSKTSYLKTRLERLEGELVAEREARKRTEENLAELRSSLRR